MRFEIKTGGAILILVGLAGLSLIVFALGLFAGYDMARNTAPEAPQAASVYPLPNPPPAQDLAKVPANLPANVAAKTATQPDNPKGANAPLAKSKPTDAGTLSMDRNAGPVAAAPHAAAIPAPIPAPKLASSDVAAKPAVNPPAKYAATTDSSAAHHKPFNIQIDAVMDRTNAEQMTARLQKLGYRAFMVPTDISGQTWWRVRVGPYQSQEEASAAEQELRAKYKDTYVP